MADYTGTIRFICEMETSALVKEVEYGETEPNEHRLVRADFSAKAVNDSIDYSYDTYSDLNDGHDITIS